MALLYAVSGITVIRADEVAIVQRWGRLVAAKATPRVVDQGLLSRFLGRSTRWCGSR